MIATEPNLCPQCRRPIAETASEGLCPACLLGGVLVRGTMSMPTLEEAVPRSIDGFELGAEIARGGMGVVYRARQTVPGRDVALKMIAAADLAGPEEVRRFKLEAEAAARLDHAHIVPVYAVGECDGRPYFVMKLAEGGTLAHCSTPLPNRAAAALLAKVARAVHFAHERGVLHRDLKPANILLDATGEPMVADFGLAKLAEAAASYTLSGTTFGTPAYMSPEQAVGGGAAATTSSDVYSLGAIFYELLAGRPPFEAPTAVAVLSRLATEEPAPPRSFNRTADAELETVCLRCLEKDPARRYPSAAALADDLDRWARGEPVYARPASIRRRVWRWVRRRPAMATALTLGTAGTAVVLAIFTRTEIAVRREKDNAIEAGRTARSEAARATASERAMRLNLYASDMAHARLALDEGNLGVAREMLTRHIPAGGTEDLRGFEWHALFRLCKGNESRVLHGHERGVMTVAFSPDGSILATGGRDGRVQLWSATDGTALRSLPLANAPIDAAEFLFFIQVLRASPEAAEILTRDPTRMAEMRMRWRPSKLGEIADIAWSPDGKRFVTAGSDAYVRVWNATDLVIEWFLPLPSVTQVAFAAAGRTLLVAVPDRDGATGEVQIHDTNTHHLIRTIKDACACFALARDGASVAVAKRDGQIEIQDIDTGVISGQWTTHSPPSRLALSRDGTVLATMENGGAEVGIWSVGERRRLGSFSMGTERARRIEIMPDNGTLLIAGTNQALQLIDIATATETRRLRGHEDEVLALALSSDGRVIASGGNDRTVRLWPIESSTARVETRADLRNPSAVSRDGRCVLEVASSNAIRCWRIETGTAAELATPGSRIPLGFSADSAHFLTVRRENERTLIERWTSDGQAIGEAVEMHGLAPGWKEAAASDVGVAFGFEKQAIEVHDSATGALLRRLEISEGNLSRLTCSSDGHKVAAFHWPREMTIWDLAGDQPPLHWQASEATVQAFVFSPDGRYLASGGTDNLVTIWDTVTGSRVVALREHKASINALAFTPDGRTLASSSTDQTLRLWHVPTWRELGVFWRGASPEWLAFAGNDPALFLFEHQRGLHVLRGRD